MSHELSEQEKKEFIVQFETIGVSAVQLAVDQPRSSHSIFGPVGKAIAARELAREWLLVARAREQRRRFRNEFLLWAGSISALAAAIFAALAFFFPAK